MMIAASATAGCGNSNNVGNVKDLSQVLLANRKIHHATMKEARVEFRSALKGLSSATEKQEQRKSFQAGLKMKQQEFQASQTATRKAFMATIDSQKEKKVARRVLKQLMQSERSHEKMKNCSGWDNAALAPHRNHFKEAMKAERQAFRASLEGLSDAEKLEKRKVFRQQIQARKKAFRQSHKQKNNADDEEDEKMAVALSGKGGENDSTAPNQAIRAMRIDHQAEMQDARQAFHGLPQTKKFPRLFQSEMQLKKRVFQAKVWVEKRRAENKPLTPDEVEAMLSIQALPEMFHSKRTSHEAGIEFACGVFHSTMKAGDMTTDLDRKEKQKTFQKGIRDKNQEFLMDMKVQVQQVFDRLNDAIVANEKKVAGIDTTRDVSMESTTEDRAAGVPITEEQMPKFLLPPLENGNAETGCKNKKFRAGLHARKKAIHALKEAHKSEMQDALKSFQKLPQADKKQKRHLFKAEMQLKKRVFQANVWAETRQAAGDDLSAEEKEALSKIQELPDLLMTRRASHEASMESDREDFRVTLEGISEAEKKKKRISFRKEMQSKNRAFRADMIATQQAAFSHLKEVESLNHACEIMETLTLGDAGASAVGETDMQARKGVDDPMKKKAKVILKRMVTGKNNLRSHSSPGKISVASLHGVPIKQTKGKWQERQAVLQTKKDGILRNIALFEAALDGMSPEEKIEKWQVRLMEIQARFVASSHDGAKGADPVANRMVRIELRQNRRAAKKAGIRQCGRHCNQNGDDAEDDTTKFEPSDDFKKDLEDFSVSMKGLSSHEQKRQWKNRIQELQVEVRKARTMVALTRKAQRRATIKENEKMPDVRTDEEGFEMVETGQDEAANDGRHDSFEEVHAETTQEKETMGTDVEFEDAEIIARPTVGDENPEEEEGFVIFA